MNVVEYDVYKNTVKKHDGFNPVSSEHNYTQLKFNFVKGDDWEKCSIITASFFQSADNIVKSDVTLISDDLTATFSIPSDFVGEKGNLNVGLQGTYTDDETEEVVTVSTNTITINLVSGVLVEERASQNLFEKILQVVNEAFNQIKASLSDKANIQQLGDLASLEELISHTDLNTIYFGTITNNFSDIFGYPDTSMSLRFMMWLVYETSTKKSYRCLALDDGTFWRFLSETDTVPQQMSVKKSVVDQLSARLGNKLDDTDGSVKIKHLAQEIIDLIGSGGVTLAQVTALLEDYAKSADLDLKEDSSNKVTSFDSSFADESNTKYPTIVALLEYLKTYYYDWDVTEEIFKSMLVDEDGNLTVTFPDEDEAIIIGNVKGVQGEQGPQGEKGDTGATGADGYSPTASVTQTDTGAVITITDKSGTATATITNGKDGLKLAGKTVVCFGDSLIGMYRGDNSATAYLAQYTGATVHNVGFGGCRMSIHPTSGYAEFCMWALADAVASGDWTAQDSAAESGSDYFPEQLELLKSIDFNNVDIALIHYGTNDFPVGKAIDSTSNPYNCDTICGALRYSIEKLLTAYPNLRIFISLPVFRFWTADDGTVTYSDTYTNGSGNTLIDVCSAIKAVANEYSLPVLDGYHGMGINKFNASTFLEDGVHHNVAGRERFGAFLGAGLIAQGADMLENDFNSGGSSDDDTTDEPTTYTNQIPISTDTGGSVYNSVGYKAGYRLSSSGAESAMDGMTVTGFIPCAYLDKVYLKNIGFNASDSTAGNQRICFYDSSKTFLGLATASTVEASLLGAFGDDGNLVQFTVTNLSGVDMTTVAYFRLNGTSIDSTSIITVNEEISSETETSLPNGDEVSY